MKRKETKLRILSLLSCLSPRHAVALCVGGWFLLSGSSAETRRWTGPDHFAMPLHDWRVEDGAFIAEPGSYKSNSIYELGSRLYPATASVELNGTLEASFELRQIEPGKKHGKIGLWLGLKSKTPSPRNVWIHPEAESAIFAGIGSDNRLVLGDETGNAILDPSKGIRFELKGRLNENRDRLELRATAADGEVHKLAIEPPATRLGGGLCLAAAGNGTKWKFSNWKLGGDAIGWTRETTVGPILWTQYTLQDDGTLKLQAQMVPLEAEDSAYATLEISKDGQWTESAKAKLEPLSSTFLFQVDDWKATQPVSYRVAYQLGGKTHHWPGTIRPNPKDKEKFTLGVFNCDHGELFPQDTMVRNVTTQDPDMLFFAGDQIYENMDGIRIVHEPLEGARLSYLNKWYQFGLTWRSLLKDRPSVIIPDDHDVFMGNIWGNGGFGYVMDPAWVNMIQRTQTGHLPDPVDPEPVARGIEVYFTALDYAGMSFAVIEDRKFKSDPSIAKDVKRTKNTDPAAYDIPGASLLGKRQVDFLKSWTARTGDLPVRWFLSQTMFSKANTHTGSNLKRSKLSLDCNGWPQSARNRALRAISRDTIMVHGDQHIGVLARMGIDKHDDGPLAFMVTGSSVGFPRAWWPEQEPKDGPINGPHTGRFIDDQGHPITIHGVTNPDPLPDGVTDARFRPDFQDKGVFAVQAAKGSGHGLVTVDKKNRTATFRAFRLNFDARKPKKTDQFPGFPVTLKLDD